MFDFCFIRLDGNYIKVLYEEILYVEAGKNYPRLVLRNHSFLSLVTMKELEASLPPGLFCRIHRSYVVSLRQIKAFNSRRVYVGEKQLPIGRNFQHALFERLPIVGGANAPAHPFSIALHPVLETRTATGGDLPPDGRRSRQEMGCL